jgi:hypothetical protein
VISAIRNFVQNLFSAKNRSTEHKQDAFEVWPNKSEYKEYLRDGHTLPVHYWNLYCPACPKPEEVDDHVENDEYPEDCDEYCGQLGCSEHGDEARDNLREQELIFAQ